MANLLNLVDVDVDVDDTAICRGVNLEVAQGETHILFGPNGCGKSSLLSAVMGLPPYRTSGTIELNGESIGDAPVDVRARGGLALAFQRPPSLRGVSLRGLARALDALNELDAAVAALDLEGLAVRDLNAGFSGGEAMNWVLNEEVSLGVCPVRALLAGRKAEVRRVAQALGF